MIRRLGLILGFLILPFVIVRDVPADIGRSGGIVVLPCAIAVANCGMALRAQHSFPDGVDLVFGMPTNLGPSIVALVQVIGGEAIVCGRISGGMLIVRNSEIASLRAAGVRSFRMLLSDSQQRGVLLEFVMHDDGVGVNVW